MASITVQATWDSEAGVWVAESEDVPGLATEAETVEALADKLRSLIPELLELNGIEPPPKMTASPSTFMRNAVIALFLPRDNGFELHAGTQETIERRRLSF